MLDNYIISVTKDELDLDKTLDSGQAFRWTKTSEGYWYGVVKDKLCVLDQYDKYIITNLDEKDSSILVDYFNLDMNYNEEVSKLDLDAYALKCYQSSKGIHILRQDYFETMVTFLMSSCNTMRNIRNIVNKLSELYGTKLEVEYDTLKFVGYTFPTLDILSNLSISDLKSCSMGFRAEYLYDMCKKLQEDISILYKLEHHVDGNEFSYKSTLELLKQFKGIGDKVANCISLFAGHHLCAFPIDTHIKQIINKEYNGSIDLTKYGNIAGLIQQYIFYNKAFGGMASNLEAR